MAGGGTEMSLWEKTEDKQTLERGWACEWGEGRKGRIGSWSLMGLPTIFRCHLKASLEQKLSALPHLILVL